MKNKKKIALIFASLLIILSLAYIAGPKPPQPIYSTLMPKASSLPQLEENLRLEEKSHLLKKGNEAEIVWIDSNNKNKTPLSIVYLHGYSASKEEGNPIHKNLAKKLKSNLFLFRLADHGIDTVAPMQYFTADRLWESGKKALQIGEAIGDKVLLIGTSTGGTLALKLAATYPEKVAGIILLSPNIEINDRSAFLLNKPWGLQLARKVIGGLERKIVGKSNEYAKYWYTHYRLESVVELQNFVKSTMNTATYKSVMQPVLLLYYYKNKKEQDPVVKVDAMLNMYSELETPTNKKIKIAIPNAGNHVLGSYITSHDLPAVELAIDSFIRQVNITSQINK